MTRARRGIELCCVRFGDLLRYRWEWISHESSTVRCNLKQPMHPPWITRPLCIAAVLRRRSMECSRTAIYDPTPCSILMTQSLRMNEENLAPRHKHNLSADNISPLSLPDQLSPRSAGRTSRKGMVYSGESALASPRLVFSTA